MKRRTRRSNPFLVILLLALVAGLSYFSFIIVPDIPPIGIPTLTPTRSIASFVNEATDLETKGKYTQAITSYQQAILVDAKDPVNYVNLARLQIYTGAYQEAVTNSGNALLLNPNNAIAHAVRGWAEGFLSNWVEAQNSLDKAISIDANNPIPHAYLAEVYILKIQAGEDSPGDQQKAIDESKTAQRLGPDIMETHRARGFVLAQTGNNAEAAQEFEAALKINPNLADLHLALGIAYKGLEQYDKAVEEFSRAYTLSPKDPQPNLLISRTLATEGQYPRAIQYGIAAVKDGPTDPFLYGNLGVLYYRVKQYTDAVQNLKLSVRGGSTSDGTAVKGLPLDYGRVAEYYYVYGLTQARLGECNEAVQIAALLQQGVPNDQIAVDNAQAMIDICRGSGTGSATTESPTATPVIPIANKPTINPLLTPTKGP